MFRSSSKAEMNASGRICLIFAGLSFCQKNQPKMSKRLSTGNLKNQTSTKFEIRRRIILFRIVFVTNYVVFRRKNALAE